MVVFEGEKKVEDISIRCIAFGEDNYEETSVESPAEAAASVAPGSTTWIDVVGLHDVELIESFGGLFGLHPLVREDIASTGQRPKVEFHDTFVFVVLKMISRTPEQGIDAEQISIVVGRDFVLSFQEREGDVFGPIRNRIRDGLGNIRSLGADYLCYALVDTIVDHYFMVLDSVDATLDQLEEAILDDPSESYQTGLRDVRKELIVLRRAVWPSREVVASLERTESDLIDRSVRPFFRDVHDHAIQILDIVESLRDVVGGLMDLYLSSLSNRMNEIMKVLTIFGTIFLPLSFIVSLYGMNFDYMPELHYRYGYPILVLAMVLLAVGMLGYFKKQKWF